MDEHRQKMAIVTRLTTVGPPEVQPADLEEPWCTILERVAPATSRAEAAAKIVQASEGLQRREDLVRDLVAMLPDDESFQPFPTLRDLSTVLPSVDWLWPGWIPRKAITLLVADPGAGKSLLALDLARRVIDGGPFPEGSGRDQGRACPVEGAAGASGDRPGRALGRAPGRALIVDAEAAPEVLNERARALGIARDGLFPFLPRDAGVGIDLNRRRQQKLLARMCAVLRPGLVVIDSLGAAAPQAEGNVGDMRALLGFLQGLAWRCDLALLLIHHLRKLKGRNAPARRRQVTLADVRGYSILTAVARSVLALSVVQAGPVPGAARREPGAARRLEVIKANLCQAPAPLGIVLGDGGPGAPILRYTEPPRVYGERAGTGRHAAWLLALLRDAGEPMKPREIIARAAERGIGESTVYRARRELGDRIEDVGTCNHDPGKRWVCRGVEEQDGGDPVTG